MYLLPPLARLTCPATGGCSTSLAPTTGTPCPCSPPSSTLCAATTLRVSFPTTTSSGQTLRRDFWRSPCRSTSDLIFYKSSFHLIFYKTSLHLIFYKSSFHLIFYKYKYFQVLIVTLLIFFWKFCEHNRKFMFYVLHQLVHSVHVRWNKVN